MNWTTAELAVLRDTYADDAIDFPAKVATERLGRPYYSVQVTASMNGFAKARRARRAAAGLPVCMGRPRVARMKSKRAPATIPTVRGEVVLPWRAGRPKGNVRPALCPCCYEVFAIPVDPRAGRRMAVTS